ncbi:tetratricopeptide repeat protein [Paraburkholderia sp. BL10I2N1]|uniref:tetratricopeptide repeat protein n=1 Tax=Paraburkholderia sp. BL10I2N1 TaxID=1938796 RepID=UPI00105DBEED|nr:tetratricopeptide repeat protein [Paraburkholderia sp. BL10I2N1]TDN63879.1 tetratricopeptide repeat protein [Paraburkholderia sp. BL10I2N1]
MTRKRNQHDISLRKLQSLLGVSRRVLSGLIAAGFVTPSRGPRNELRFTFRDVVVLRTAFQLQSAKISSRKILAALARLKAELPDELPLSGIRVTAVGNTVAVKTGPSKWDANTGQLFLDFEIAEIKGDVVFLETSPEQKDAVVHAEEWYALAEQLADVDAGGAEQAYRKAIELSPEPFYAAYVDLGALLCEDEQRCEDALGIFEQALALFPEDAVLHFNRAVALEGVGRLEDAERSYARCLEINPSYADAHHNLGLLRDRRGDKQGLVRHLSAWRRLNS